MDLISIGFILVLSIFSVIKPATSISPALLLSPYLHENKTLIARNLSVVNPSLFLNRTSHAGFLTIDPLLHTNTFFWYFPVEGKPVGETPWIIWLQGGPGVSSLDGLFSEIGPFQYSDGELKPRKYSWSSNHSLLFMDIPVGVGFSFSDSGAVVPTKNTHITKHSSQLYSALQQFLTLFPELRKAPLFIAGESYAGRYVPALATDIMESQLPEDWQINLEGLIMGNPILNQEDIMNVTDAFYQWGLIDSQGVLAVKPVQDMYFQAVKLGKSDLAYDLRHKLLDKIMDISMQQQMYNMLADRYRLTDFESYLAREDVREALHVGEVKYRRFNYTTHYIDFLSQEQPMVERLLERYKILIYCGQLDLAVPCVPNAEARRRNWHWSKRDEFLKAARVPWWYNESVAGYVKTGGGFTEALVRGAGHLTPLDKPAQILQLVSSFIHDIEMELPPNYQPRKEDTPLIQETTPKPEITTQPPISTTHTPTNISHSTIKPEQTKSEPQVPTAITSISIGTIVSIILNVILVIIVALGAILYVRLKRRSEDFFYNNIETNNSDDLFLT